MQQISNVQAPDATPSWPAQPNTCAVGPSSQGRGLAIQVYNASIILTLYYFKDPRRPQEGVTPQTPFGFPPAAQTYPGCVGFTASNFKPGTPATVYAQLYERSDGPMPSAASTITGELTASGTFAGVTNIQPTPLASFPPAVTPADGDLIVLELPSTYDPVGGKKIRWLLSYDAADAVYLAVGPCAPLYAEVQTQEAIGGSVGVYTALATPGPTIMLPRPGDYNVSVGSAQGDNVGACWHSYDIGLAGAVDADAAGLNIVAATSAPGVSVMRIREKVGLAATSLTSKYKGNNGLNDFQSRFLSVIPLRIT